MMVVMVEPKIIHLTIWTLNLMIFPINQKMIAIKPLSRLALPTIVSIDRAKQINMPSLAAN